MEKHSLELHVKQFTERWIRFRFAGLRLLWALFIGRFHFSNGFLQVFESVFWLKCCSYRCCCYRIFNTLFNWHHCWHPWHYQISENANRFFFFFFIPSQSDTGEIHSRNCAHCACLFYDTIWIKSNSNALPKLKFMFKRWEYAGSVTIVRRNQFCMHWRHHQMTLWHIHIHLQIGYQ